MRRPRIPIAIKLVFLIVAILIIATGFISFNSYNLFEKTSRGREESFAENQARARADEVQSLLKSYQDKSKVAGSLILKNFTEANDFDSSDALKLSFAQDRELVNIEIYKKTTGQAKLLVRRTNEAYLKKYLKDASYITAIRQKFRFPVSTLFAGQFVIRNSSLKSSVPLITIGFPLISNENGKITHTVVVDINSERIQSIFSEVSASTIYLVDNTGTVLAHPNEELFVERKNLSDLPIVKTATTSKQKRMQTQYTNPLDDQKYIAAFSKTEFDVSVIAEIPEWVVLEPALIVRRESIFIAGIVLSFALFFIFIFSITLTSPIEKLVELTDEISKGNFDVRAQKLVKSKDEVGDLAEAFDHMTEGLRERDKVKNLFSKFHGSSVAEDLIENDVAVGGSNKEVTVFFSDIRGFTAFSENKTPEEVVEMLNEYFERMVAIITKNNGIVDKFIGDAIMAVWGAPKSMGDDASNAVKACIEMRESLAELNAIRQERGQIPIMIGMGLHSGRAISGTIGSLERMEYTVIGDAVNMAARIEAATKAFGTDLLVSEITAAQIGESFIIEQAGAAEVKGKSEPLKLFKIRGYVDEDGNKVEVRTPYSDYTAEKADKVKVA